MHHFFLFLETLALCTLHSIKRFKFLLSFAFYLCIVNLALCYDISLRLFLSRTQLVFYVSFFRHSFNKWRRKITYDRLLNVFWLSICRQTGFKHSIGHIIAKKYNKADFTLFSFISFNLIWNDNIFLEPFCKIRKICIQDSDCRPCLLQTISRPSKYICR